MATKKMYNVSKTIDKAHSLGLKEATKRILPTDDEVDEWYDLNIGSDCSASSAIYKFRLWLKERSL